MKKNIPGLQEVPTEDLLNFQDYPTVHSPSNLEFSSNPTVNVDISPQITSSTYEKTQIPPPGLDEDTTSPNVTTKSFWTLEYYQQFFDVDTQDVLDRIVASVIPKGTGLKNSAKHKPDLYGPFWISVTLIFTIAISGNIANYLQYANVHWKYDFHLVSYAATAICLYVMVVPLALWGLLKWSSDVNDLDGLEDVSTPGTIELICIYGYSLFVYIPVSILWTIQINWLQWSLVLVAALLSGAVLLLTLMPALKLSRHKILLTVAIVTCHFLLAAGFMLYFFHVPKTLKTKVIDTPSVSKN